MALNLEHLKERPHLVILGAGATIATIPRGDRNGRKSSLMDNFINELGLNELLNNVIFNTNSNNLENIYSELYDREDCRNIRLLLETKIREYFDLLQLSDHPTIYDLLIISLRKKDAIATFNWDPLLLQAYNRVRKITDDLPELLFLHGCVHAGICERDNRFGHIKAHCPVCGRLFQKVPLLYPVKHKDYTSNIFIRDQWQIVKNYLQQSLILTIFGYGAPKTDEDALQLLHQGYGSDLRYLDQVEIIDIKDHNQLYETWNYFFDRSHGHLKIHDSFFDSLIAEFPRRSVEGYYKRNIEGWWGESSFSLKTNYQTFLQLRNDIQLLLRNESKGNFEVI